VPRGLPGWRGRRHENGSGNRSLTAQYVAAPFSMGYVDFYTFQKPRYALSLGFDAAEVGILVGARSIVAMFLSKASITFRA